LTSFSFVQEGTSQLTRRFADGAAAGEDTKGFVGRYTNSLWGPLAGMGDAHLFGDGLGIGTNAGAGLLTGDRAFLGAEDEWGRLFFESGPIFGSLLVIMRLALTVTLFKCAFDALRRDNMLPMLIFSSCMILVLNGQWGVPTSLGFAIFGAGLTLAACVEPEEEEDEYDEEEGDGEEHADEDSEHSPATDTLA
jgi:hypothetical protein